MKNKRAFIIGMIFFGGLLSLQATAPQKNSITSIWFKFIGTNDADISQVTDPANYQLLPGLPPNGFPNFYLNAIRVESTTEIYPAGHPYAGLPRVNVIASLRDDLLYALGITPPYSKHEILNRVLLGPTL